MTTVDIPHPEQLGKFESWSMRNLDFRQQICCQPMISTRVDAPVCFSKVCALVDDYEASLQSVRCTESSNCQLDSIAIFVQVVSKWSKSRLRRDQAVRLERHINMISSFVNHSVSA
jgi:hypothetical protein